MGHHHPFPFQRIRWEGSTTRVPLSGKRGGGHHHPLAFIRWEGPQLMEYSPILEENKGFTYIYIERERRRVVTAKRPPHQKAGEVNNNCNREGVEGLQLNPIPEPL